MKKLIRFTFAAGAVAVISQAISAQPYVELTPNFNRARSNCMVRKVSVPTLANLDYAAYNANPVLYEEQKVKPKKPAEPVTLASIQFGGALADVVDDIRQTPLTDDEKSRPMAWRPLNKKLWDVVKHDGFQNIGAQINGYKWADPSIYQAYQEISAAYLHGTGADAQIWVCVEFSPWVTFLNAAADDDRDGYREIYGRLNVEAVPADVREKAYAWMAEDYLVRTVDREAVIDWIIDLASYWYPTKNTDMVDMGSDTIWPNAQTEKEVVKTLKGLRVANPTAVVRGRPFQKPIYNVYVVEGLGVKAQSDGAGGTPVAAASGDKKMDRAVSKNFTDNMARFETELKTNGGSYAAWEKKYASFAAELKKLLATLPQEQMGVKGKNDWVFFKKDFEYMTAGDLAGQAKDKNAIPHLVDLKKYLDGKNINLLFVAVPNKSEVYFEQLPVAAVPKDALALVNPWGRKFLKDVQEAGVEVIDLLPHFLAAKKEDSNHKEPVYQKQDTHWTNRGLEIAAQLIADRITRYAWYEETAKASAVAYTMHDTIFQRQGDIIERLPEADRSAYPPVTLAAKQVVCPDGAAYKQNLPDAPVLLMGDSFTGVFELVDCKSAGVGSHIAAKTGLPVDIITSWGGGPLVRDKVMRGRAKNMGSKRLIIYMMVARDLYNYAQGWEPLKAQE